MLLGGQNIAQAAPAPALKTETFDHDPAWEGHNNRVEAKAAKDVHQDFGYSGATHFAGKEPGEIGGTIFRGGRVSSYADQIPARTLQDPLSASGTFAITRTDGSSGIFLGWFKADQTEPGRQNSLGLHFAGQGGGARITLQLVTAANQACGTKITPWTVDKNIPKGEAGRKVRPPEVRNDGTRYTWKLDYDPEANGGNGQMSFTIHGNAEKHDAWEDKVHTVDLPKGYKDQGTTFNRFGLMNSIKAGNAMTFYLDDLEHDGRAQAFDKDPGWIGIGNVDAYERTQDGGVHDFGFSDATHFAGGAKPGELGGILWRSGSYGYYADPHVGPLSLNDRLEARGKVVLSVGPPDSGMYIGWFNGAEKELSPTQAGQFVGVKIGGPTHVGHYFTPAYATAQTKLPEQGKLQHEPNVSVERGTGPLLVPKKVFDWKIVYDPAASGGQGAITVTLGEESVTLALKPGDKAKGATLDHFGLFTLHRGGNYVKIYFDDLAYTAAKGL